MKVASLILGIIGGSAVLAVGGVGGTFVPLTIALLGLIGGTLAMYNSLVAGILMVLSCLGLLWMFGLNVLTGIPIILLGVGAALSFLSLQEPQLQKT